MKKTTDLERLTVEFDISSFIIDDSLYVDFYALKEPKNILQKIARWYLRRYAFRPTIINLTTKEIPIQKSYSLPKNFGRLVSNGKGTEWTDF